MKAGGAGTAAARFNYGNGKSKRQQYGKNKKLPKNLQGVESKIKDRIAYFKQMKKEQQHEGMFSKDPQVVFKERPEHYIHDAHLDEASMQTNPLNASLRRRSPCPTAHSRNGM